MAQDIPGLPPPRPIPLKERASLVFVERAQLDVDDGAFVAIDADGIRTHIPVGGVACLLLEPGIRVSHAAVALAARGHAAGLGGGGRGAALLRRPAGRSSGRQAAVAGEDRA